MTSLIILLLAFLLIYSVPVFVMRGGMFARVQDYSVSCGPTAPGVVQNSLIAYSLRLTLLGPFFVWGARGDLLPAVVVAVAAAFGVVLLYALRRPIADFQRAALDRDQSMTVHAFIARQYGTNSCVRTLAATLTLIALSGFLVTEAVAVATLLKGMQIGAETWTFIGLGALLISVPLYALPSGHSAVMQSAQSQLGALYFGLFAATVLLLYLLLAAFRPMPPHGTLAIACIAVICLAMVIYRRSRYVDTGPIVIAAAANGGAPIEPRAGKLFRRLGKVLNPLISAFLVTAIVFAGMGLYSYGIPTLLAAGAGVFAKPSSVSGLELVAFGLLALFYPIADVTHWQRIAAVARDGVGADSSSVFGGVVRIYATEIALLLIFTCMLGTLAVSATGAPDSADIIDAFIGRLAFQQNLIAVGALSLLLLSVIAIAFSTMISLFSASICTIECDLLPAAVRQPDATTETPSRRRTFIAGLGLFAGIAGAVTLVLAFLPTSFAGRGFAAALVAFACCQLSFVPLVVGAALGFMRGGAGALSPRWAVVALGTGALAGIAAVAAFLLTGHEAWIWAAVPACLAAGTLVCAVARQWPRHHDDQRICT